MRPRPAVRVSNTVFGSAVSFSRGMSVRRFLGSEFWFRASGGVAGPRRNPLAGPRVELGPVGYALRPNPPYEASFKHGAGADRRAGAVAEFQRQADEAELAL